MHTCIVSCCLHIAQPAQHHDDNIIMHTGANTALHHAVWWNAWLYSGSDSLWAGLIKELHCAVEDHYGPHYKHAERHAQAVHLVLEVVVIIAVVAGLQALWSPEEASRDSYNGSKTNQSSGNHTAAEVLGGELGGLLSLVVSAAAGIGSAGAILRTMWGYLHDTSHSSRVLETASSPTFRQKLGYMDLIKQELARIGKILEGDPEFPVPNLWHFLLPGLLPDDARDWMKKAWSDKRHHKCRLVIFVDDLDRCPPEKSVEVLEALQLLTEGTPFFIVLAIDPRIVVTAIESNNEGFYNRAGVNGLEYLDKIVQIPFSIPALVVEEKRQLLQGYLSPEEQVLEVRSLREVTHDLPSAWQLARREPRLQLVVEKLLHDQDEDGVRSWDQDHLLKETGYRRCVRIQPVCMCTWEPVDGVEFEAPCEHLPVLLTILAHTERCKRHHTGQSQSPDVQDLSSVQEHAAKFGLRGKFGKLRSGAHLDYATCKIKELIDEGIILPTASTWRSLANDPLQFSVLSRRNIDSEVRTSDIQRAGQR